MTPVAFTSFTAPVAPVLTGKTVLITGASRGLGRAIALDCARHHANTLLLGRDVRRLEALADEIEQIGAPPATLIPFNLEGATVEDYGTISALIGEQFQKLEGLVLNAAVLGELAAIENYDPLQWARVFQVNVHSQFLLVQACLPVLRRADSSSVIFTSSGVGRQGRANWGAYAASKFALEGLMETLADEQAGVSSVRVNSLNPGPMRTRMRALAFPAEDPGTLPDPAAIAPYYSYLLSEASLGLHGQALTIPK
ncbi:MAG: YciK family oxidoreductase [Gammaproteobacteria bacterium]|nr:YciK family oxidoreductase [Gammaproteobacteria bacterium]